MCLEWSYSSLVASSIKFVTQICFVLLRKLTLESEAGASWYWRCNRNIYILWLHSIHAARQEVWIPNDRGSKLASLDLFLLSSGVNKALYLQQSSVSAWSSDPTRPGLQLGVVGSGPFVKRCHRSVVVVRGFLFQKDVLTCDGFISHAVCQEV